MKRDIIRNAPAIAGVASISGGEDHGTIRRGDDQLNIGGVGI